MRFHALPLGQLTAKRVVLCMGLFLYAALSTTAFCQTMQAKRTVFPSKAETPNSGITSGGLLAANPAIIIGEIRTFAFGDGASIAQLEAQGWLPCGGQSLDNNTTNGFPELAGRIEAKWGSDEPDAAHVFNVPDLRGMFLRGFTFGTIPENDPAGDSDPRTAPRPDGKLPGASTGVGSYQVSATINHLHPGIVAGPLSGERALLYTQQEQINDASAYRWQTNQTAQGAGTWWQRTGDPNTQPSGGASNIETRGKNVSVLFAIYTGRKVVSPAP